MVKATVVFIRVYIALLFLLMLGISSCKRNTDDLAPVTTDAALVKKFFSTSLSNDPAVSKVMNRLRKYPGFIPAFIKANGWALWDKAIVYNSRNNPFGTQTVPGQTGVLASGSNSNQETEKILIPLLEDNGKRIKTMLACSVRQNDSVQIRVIRAGDYKWYNTHAMQTGMDGQGLSLIFMKLDKEVFGHSLFKISDPTLFKISDNKYATYLRLDPKTESVQSTSSTVDYVCINFMYEAYIPTNGGQVVGCPPGQFCPLYQPHTVTKSICKWTFTEDPGTGDPGTGGTGGTGSGPGGSPGSSNPNYPPDYFDPCDPFLPPPPSGMDPPACQLQTIVPWDPEEANYLLTAEDINIWNEIEMEGADGDALRGKDCQGTNRTGNIQWPGTLEHWVIMLDYVVRNPASGQVEYQIPGAGGSGGKGYADMVNTITGEIFEIKPMNPAGIAAGTAEVANYVVKANLGCPAGAIIPWNAGSNYPIRILPNPKNPGQNIEASLAANGVIVYQNVPGGNVNPLPVIIPQTVLDKLKNLIEKLGRAGADFKQTVTQFLRDPQNADVVNYIKNAAIIGGIGIIVGTIVEDVLTLGAGIADDWASFILAYRIIQFATKL